MLKQIQGFRLEERRRKIEKGTTTTLGCYEIRVGRYDSQSDATDHLFIWGPKKKNQCEQM